MIWPRIVASNAERNSSYGIFSDGNQRHLNVVGKQL